MGRRNACFLHFISFPLGAGLMKILLFVFKSLNGLAPEYLSDLIKLHQFSRALRSTNQVVLDVPRSFLKCRGNRGFAVVAPTLWNALPLSVRNANSFSTFKTLLKTQLLNLAEYSHFYWVFNLLFLSILLFYVFVCYMLFYCFYYFCLFYCKSFW